MTKEQREGGSSSPNNEKWPSESRPARDVSKQNTSAVKRGQLRRTSGKQLVSEDVSESSIIRYWGENVARIYLSFV